MLKLVHHEQTFIMFLFTFKLFNYEKVSINSGFYDAVLHQRLINGAHNRT